jgi:hypothetical protein
MVNERRDRTAAGNSEPFEEYTYERPSTRRSYADSSTPLDEEGIPFLRNEDVGPLFGRFGAEAKRTSWERNVPQWKFLPKHTTGAARAAVMQGDPVSWKNTTTYFSLADVHKHVGKELNAPHPNPDATPQQVAEHKALNKAIWGPLHQHLGGMLKDHRTRLAERRAAGENPGWLKNQESPQHKDVHLSLLYFPKGRPVTAQAPEEAGNVEVESPKTKANPFGTSSDLKGPIINGLTKPGSRVKRRRGPKP